MIRIHANSDFSRDIDTIESDKKLSRRNDDEISDLEELQAKAVQLRKQNPDE